jgi:hypothetical protein
MVCKYCMELFCPQHQFKLRNTSVDVFGYDKTAEIQYSFNSQGFRGPELSDKPSIIVIGNSVSFGIGLDQTQTFVHMLAQHMHMPYFNASFGCWFHENHDHLHNLRLLRQRQQPDIFVIQINNLDRLRIRDTVVEGNNPDVCQQRFLEFWNQAQEILADRDRLWLYWDDINHHLPQEITAEFCVYNQWHLDQSLPDKSFTFGSRSHRMVFLALKSQLDQKKHLSYT